MSMRSVVSTRNAPAAPPHLSQGVAGGGFVFVSGQVPKDPVSGKLVDGGEAQARQCLRNVQAILEASGSSLDRVMMTLVYVTDLRIKEEVNRVFLEFFPASPPSRALVEVSAIADGVLVEVLAIALS